MAAPTPTWRRRVRLLSGRSRCSTPKMCDSPVPSGVHVLFLPSLSCCAVVAISGGGRRGGTEEGRGAGWFGRDGYRRLLAHEELSEVRLAEQPGRQPEDQGEGSHSALGEAPERRSHSGRGESVRRRAPIRGREAALGRGSRACADARGESGTPCRGSRVCGGRLGSGAQGLCRSSR